MSDKHIRVDCCVHLYGHPNSVLFEALKVDANVLDDVQLTITAWRSTKWWNRDFYRFPPIKDGNATDAIEMLNGLYKQAILPQETMDELLQYVDDACRATRR